MTASIIIDGQALTADDALRMLPIKPRAPIAESTAKAKLSAYRRRLERIKERSDEAWAALQRQAVAADPGSEAECPPQYIEAECRLIRKGWSPRERRRRAEQAGSCFSGLAIQVVKVAGFTP